MTIEYAVNFQIDDQVTVMQELVDAFKEQTGITVELTLNGTDYEATMKTRMASGDLPDLWNTHGWSVARYSEFLTPLNDQPWYQYVDESVKGTVQDSGGNIYILPICEGANGILYNAEVLQNNGIDPAALADMADFEAAMDKHVPVQWRQPDEQRPPDGRLAPGLFDQCQPGHQLWQPAFGRHL